MSDQEGVHIVKWVFDPHNPSKNVLIAHDKKDCPGFPACTCMLAGPGHQPPDPSKIERS